MQNGKPVGRLGSCTGGGWSMHAKREAHGAAGKLYRRGLEACLSAAGSAVMGLKGRFQMHW